MPGLPRIPSHGDSVIDWARQVNELLRQVMLRGGRQSGSNIAAAPVRTSRNQRRVAEQTIRKPFQLIASSDGGSPAIWVKVSTVTDLGVPTGFHATEATKFFLAPTSGTRYVHLKVTIDAAGLVDEAEVVDDASISPAGSDTVAYAPLGWYTYTPAAGETPASLVVGNYGFGPATVTTCREPGTNDPIVYNITIALTGG